MREEGGGEAGVFERSVGDLVLVARGEVHRVSLGATAPARGLVLGRYDRCLGGAVSLSHQVSRVHAVVVAIAGEVHIIDVGSTNGVNAMGAEVRCEPMKRGLWFGLAELTVTWEPACEGPNLGRPVTPGRGALC